MDDEIPVRSSQPILSPSRTGEARRNITRALQQRSTGSARGAAKKHEMAADAFPGQEFASKRAAERAVAEVVREMIQDGVLMPAPGGYTLTDAMLSRGSDAGIAHKPSSRAKAVVGAGGRLVER